MEVTGASIVYQNDWFFLSGSVVTTWIVMAVITLVCIFLTRNLKVHADTKRQVVAEFLVNAANNLVKNNMGERFSYYAPLAAAVLAISVCSSLSSLLGAFPPTGDFSSVLGWALVIFTLITYWKIKAGGIGNYLKSYLQPVAVLLPINIISEFMTPMSMAFRHFGNIASGMIISMLVYSALAGLSATVLGAIPGVVGQILSGVPIFQVGIPAILSVYFDLFSSCIQAFIFCMLMMVNIKLASEG